MPSFTRINLLEQDDFVAGRAQGVEGRFGRTALGTSDVGVSHFRYAPEFVATTGHRHREQEEVYVIVAGSGRMLIDGEVIDVAQWDAIRLAPKAVRAFAAGSDGLEVIAVGGPKPEGGDGEPVPVEWPGTAPSAD